MSWGKWPSGRIRRGVFGACVVALAIGVLPSAGCRGDRTDKPPRQFFPDMDDQPRWNPQSRSEFFVDGRTMRTPPPGTVPFGGSEVVADAPWADPLRANRDKFLRASYEVYDGTDDYGDPVTEIPVDVTPELLETGRSKFNIYCSVCHGYNGEGAGGVNDANRGGMVGRRWSIPVANLHDPMYLPGGERGADGYLYTVVRHGVNNAGNQTMPGYSYALDPRDSWAVVAYIRALQKTRLGEIADVPESERPHLGEPPAQPAPAEGQS